MAALERFGNYLVVVARVAPAVAAAVYPRSVKILLEQTAHDVK